MEYKVGDVVVCEDTGGYNLTIGKRYKVKEVRDDTIRVLNDLNRLSGYYKSRFVLAPRYERNLPAWW